MPRYELGLWRGVPGAAPAALRKNYVALREQFGPFRRPGLARRWAKLVAEVWYTAEAASGEAVLTVARRQEGKGRRPSKPQMLRDLKRQGISVDGLEPLLRRLEGLAGVRGKSALARLGETAR